MRVADLTYGLLNLNRIACLKSNIKLSPKLKTELCLAMPFTHAVNLVIR